MHVQGTVGLMTHGASRLRFRMPCPSTSPYWDMSDSDLRAGGTLVKRGEHAPGVPFAYIRDPDGYVIELLP